MVNSIRTRGEPAECEFSVEKVDAYNGINSYLSSLSGTEVKTFEDIVAYNAQNAGTEGAEAGDIPAFPSGQVFSALCYICLPLMI